MSLGLVELIMHRLCVRWTAGLRLIRFLMNPVAVPSFMSIGPLS